MLPTIIFSALCIVASGLPAERQVVSVGGICPIPMCAFPDFCNGPITTSTFQFEGMECPGCPMCQQVGDTLPVQKRQLHLACPQLMCMAVMLECEEPAIHTFVVNGHTCRGCPYCPTPATTTASPVQRAIGIALAICPIVDCAYMDLSVCSVPLQQHYISINGHQCPGCLHCPVVSAIVKRQHHPICPIVDCFFPVNECSVPVVIGTFTVNGHECPGCPYCPSSTTTGPA